MKPAGLVLCGGRSRRFGGMDKMLAPLGGRPLLGHVIERISPQVSRLALNVNGDPAPYRGFGLDIVPDTLPDRPGPLAGVLAGLVWAGGDALLTVPGDEPFVPLDLAARLAAASGAIRFATSAGREHWLSALWSPVLAPDLESALVTEGLDRVRAFIQRHAHAAVAFPAQERDPFFNINTAEDLAAAQDILDIS